MHKGFGKILRWTCCLCMLGLVAGCGASFAYNRLDALIPWYVTSYVDLDRGQRKALRSQLQPALRWHREQELLRYVEILDRIENDLRGEVTGRDVQGWIDAVIAAAERAERVMLEVALEFGATMGRPQIDEFTSNVWEQQREFEREFLDRSDEEYRTDAYQDLARLLRRFTGRLERPQEQRLRDAAGELRRFDRPWLDERARWLQDLEFLLQREPGWEKAVMSAYLARRQHRGPAYEEALAYNLQVITAAIADVLNQLDDQQRRRVAREIDDLRRRLHELAAGAPVA